jgi:hypothetical protein
MTTVIVYRSTDGSAPVLTGAVGALTGVLDACLVNGYSGKSAAGWTIAYTATNKRAYRNSATDGTGYYLNVDDTASGTAGAKEAFCTGFQTMSAISTGTGQFPTSSQLGLGSAPAGAVVARKSNTADSTARAWTLIADDTVFYLFMETGDVANPTGTSSLWFGDIFSYASSDPNRCMIVGRNNVNIATGAVEQASQLSLPPGASILYGTLAGHFMAQSYTGLGGSIMIGKHTDYTKAGYSITTLASLTGTTAISNSVSIIVGNAAPGSFPYPNGADGGLYMAPIWAHHSGTVRGYFKGLWAPLHTQPLGHNDTFSGAGAMSGKSLLCQGMMGFTSAAFLGQIFVETSSTWS